MCMTIYYMVKQFRQNRASVSEIRVLGHGLYVMMQRARRCYGRASGQNSERLPE